MSPFVSKSAEPEAIVREPRRPAVWLWLRVYCGLLALTCALLAAAGLLPAVVPERLAESDSSLRTALARNPEATRAFLGFFGVVFACTFGAPLPLLVAGLVWPRRRSAWGVGWLAIAAGFFTPCGWVATLPLAVFWARPEVRAYFDRAWAPRPAEASSPKPPEAGGGSR